MKAFRSAWLLACLLGAAAACRAEGGTTRLDGSVGAPDGAGGPDGAVALDGAPPPPPGSDGAAPPPPGPDGAVPPPDAGEGARDAGAATLPFCRLACATAADCAQPSAAYDEDNYRCAAGVCEYTGCRSDDECRAVFMSGAYVCSDALGLPSCLQACATAGDCGTGSAAFDADNYRCDAGVCLYEGCRDDAECAATFFDPAYDCRDVLPPDTGLPLPVARRNCVRSCTAPADCAQPSPAFDADNYACEGGACRYVGCRDDDECRLSLMRSDYVCR